MLNVKQNLVTADESILVEGVDGLGRALEGKAGNSAVQTVRDKVEDALVILTSAASAITTT